MGSEQVVDLRRVVHVVSQQRLLVLACAAIGIMLGLLLAFQQAPTYVARSLVLLPPSGVDVRGNLLRNMLTEMQIASSGEIIEKVGSSLNPPLAPQEVRSRITVDATSSDLLQVTAEGGSGEQAALIADGVANAYVEYSNGTTSANSSAEIEGLVVRAGELDQRIQQLEEDIVSATAEVAALGEAGQESPEGLRRTALIDSLRIDQADSARQLSNINNRIAEARLDAELRRRGTRLLQPAIPPSAPSSPKPVVNAVVGALAGGLLGLLVVLARQLRGRRLVRRDDIADVVAAPVLASLNVPPVKGIGGYREVLDSWEPDVVETWALRQAVARLGLSGAEPPTHIVVITLAGDRMAGLAAVQLAIFTAESEIPTALVVTGEDAQTSALRAACHAGPTATRPHLTVFASSARTAEDDAPAVLGRLTITSVVADPGRLVLPVRRGPTLTTLAVSSGFATASLVASTAIECADAGQPISGVLVVNPDPGDPTTGRPDMSLPTDRHGRGAEGASAEFRALPTIPVR